MESDRPICFTKYICLANLPFDETSGQKARQRPFFSFLDFLPRASDSSPLFHLLAYFNSISPSHPFSPNNLSLHRVVQWSVYTETLRPQTRDQMYSFFPRQKKNVIGEKKDARSSMSGVFYRPGERGPTGEVWSSLVVGEGGEKVETHFLSQILSIFSTHSPTDPLRSFGASQISRVSVKFNDHRIWRLWECATFGQVVIGPLSLFPTENFAIKLLQTALIRWFYVVRKLRNS